VSRGSEMLKHFALLCTKIGLYHRDDAQKSREVRARVLAKVVMRHFFPWEETVRVCDIMNKAEKGRERKDGCGGLNSSVIKGKHFISRSHINNLSNVS